ncbi:hypothetical protein B0I72DRAFT_129611 [Yarrowia lipolytica]|uniref:Uncharacterized protein n=1 Tax=Yarrowia lipolytica TaxID=4952 RepID=A0A371C5P2_YARLL|nr:hypothetical protein B0I71DRAFT_140881 [Yarrowia lipolytica]RDW31910.1 hypothetical protein B0I72DRAFT_129611 [Yarrowia lipolytica]
MDSSAAVTEGHPIESADSYDGIYKFIDNQRRRCGDASRLTNDCRRRQEDNLTALVDSSGSEKVVLQIGLKNFNSHSVIVVVTPSGLYSRRDVPSEESPEKSTDRPTRPSRQISRKTVLPRKRRCFTTYFITAGALGSIIIRPFDVGNARRSRE